MQLAQGWTRMTSNDIAFGVEQMMSLPAESTVATSRSETSDEQFNYLGLYLHQSALFLQDSKKTSTPYYLTVFCSSSLADLRLWIGFKATADRELALVGSEERTWLSIQEPKGNHTWSCLATRA